MSKQYDIALWGCTGHTGRLVALVLARRFGLQNQGMRLALVGRSKRKMEELAEAMLLISLTSPSLEVRKAAKTLQQQYDKKQANSLIPILVIENSSIEGTVYNMATQVASQSKVVISTAGPYAKIGEDILRSCAEQGTDYVDCTGEYTWVKLMYHRYHQVAVENRARLLPLCGIAYLLNDIGVSALQRQATYLGSSSIPEIEQYISVKGFTFSPGTMKSLFGFLKKISLYKMVFDTPEGPFEMCQSIPTTFPVILNANKYPYWTPRHSHLTHKWIYPIPLGRGGVRYIHWTNEIQGYPYGRNFIYRFGEEKQNIIVGFVSLFIQCFLFFFCCILSKFEFIVNKLLNLMTEKYNWEDVFSLENLEKPDNYVKFTSYGEIKLPKDNTVQAIKHEISFYPGEAYMATACGLVAIALACIYTNDKNRTPSQNNPIYGMGCPSQLLGKHAEKEMNQSQFITTFKLCQLSK